VTDRLSGSTVQMVTGGIRTDRESCADVNDRTHGLSCVSRIAIGRG
jgi:hypothetical protein